MHMSQLVTALMRQEFQFTQLVSEILDVFTK